MKSTTGKILLAIVVLFIFQISHGTAHAQYYGGSPQPIPKSTPISGYITSVLGGGNTSPAPASTPFFPPLGSIFNTAPYVVTLNDFGVNSSYSCNWSTLSANALFCSNPVSGVSFTAACSADIYGHTSCEAAMDAGDLLHAYLNRDRMYAEGAIESLMYKLCYDSNGASCELHHNNLDFYLTSTKWSGYCHGSVNGNVNWNIACSGDYSGSVTGTGVVKVKCALPVAQYAVIQANVVFQPSVSGSVGAHKFFNLSCPVSGTVSVYPMHCPDGLDCCGRINFGAGAVFKTDCIDPSGNMFGAGCWIKW